MIGVQKIMLMRNHYLFGPTDPMLVWYNPLPDDATPEELDLYLRIAVKSVLHGFLTFITVIALLALMSLLTGCTPQRIVFDTQEQRHTQEMLQRMDSTLMAHSIARQDSTWHQEIMRQFQSIREKSDTSHSVTLNAAGDTILERIIINNIRETATETDREHLTVMSHRLEVMDSTVQVQCQQISRMDSLLRQQKQTEIKEVAKPLNWWQQMQIWLGRLVIVALAVLTGIWLIRKRTRWLRFFIKHE